MLSLTLSLGLHIAFAFSLVIIGCGASHLSLVQISFNIMLIIINKSFFIRTHVCPYIVTTFSGNIVGYLKPISLLVYF